MKRSFPLWLLGFGHGLNDFIAGYLLAYLLLIGRSLTEISTCFLAYNLLAFGGQYFAAMWLQQGLRLQRAFLLTAALNSAAVFCFFVSPLAALVLAGCASALYHVTGGTMAARTQKATAIGLFAAPGILGLALGGYLAGTGADAWVYMKWVTLIFIFPGFLFSFDHAPVQQNPPAPAQHLDKHDYLMVLLLSVITLRSAIWNIVQLVHQHNLTWLVWIGVSACAGKIIGGWLADRVGWRLYNLLSLSMAAPLVHFFRHELVLFCIGVALLQSGIPANTAMVVQLTRNHEKGIAFTFGTAILVAGIIGVATWRVDGALPALGLLCLILAIVAQKRTIGKVKRSPFRFPFGLFNS